MVKTQGPIQSVEAAGQLAKTLAFAKLKNTSYLKTYSVPHNPKTPGQVATRANIRFLSQNWQSLSLAHKATWVLPAKTLNLAPYQAYLKINAQRWVNWLPPSKTYPAPPAGGPWTLRTFSAVKGNTWVKFTFQTWASFPAWGILLIRDTTWPPNQIKTNTIALVTASTTSTFSYWTDLDLEPGTYNYQAKPFNTDGQFGSWTARIQVTVP